MPEISSPAELKAYLLEHCSSEEVARRDFFRILDEMEPVHTPLDHEEYTEDEYEYIDLEDEYDYEQDPFDLEGQQDRFWNDPTG